MDLDEVRSLLNKVWRFHPRDADGIVGYIISRKTLAEIREYLLAPDDQIRPLIVEAMSSIVPRAQQFSLLPPPLQPSWGHGLLPFPNSQPQFHHPSGSSHGFQAPLPPNVQPGPLHHGLPQLHPSGDNLGIQTPFPFIDPPGALQSPFPEFMDLGERFQSLSIPGDGLPSSHPNASQNVTRYSPSSSKAQTKPCRYYFSWGDCKKGESCRFSHASGFPETQSARRLGTLESLPMLGKKIREILFAQRPPLVAIEHLAKMYIERHGKPLKIEGFCMEDQQNGSKPGCSLRDLLVQINTTRVIERQGKHYIVPVEEAPKYLSGDFKLVKPPASYGSKRIYITFDPKSTFTRKDARRYFSRYGPVNDVQIPHREKRMFGYVSFLYPETVERILSERSPRTPHFICGDRVLVKAYKGKHELEKLAQDDAHSNSDARGSSKKNSGARNVADVYVIHEYQTGKSVSRDYELFPEKLNNGRDVGIATEKRSTNIASEMSLPPTHHLFFRSVNEAGPSQADNTAESSHVSNRLDGAPPAAQDIYDFLPDDLY